MDLAQSSLIVAGLAAIASFVNAAVSILNAWAEGRGLRVGMVPMSEKKAFDFCVTITNPSRRPNWIASVQCRTERGPFQFASFLDLDEPIQPFSQRKGRIAINRVNLPEDWKRVTVVIAAVRGRRYKETVSRNEVERHRMTEVS